jgi:hypothetical protein
VVGIHVTVSKVIIETSAAIDSANQRTLLRALRYFNRATRSRPAPS